MNTDQQSLLQSALNEFTRELEKRSDTCVTLEVENSSEWIQITQDCINMSWNGSQEQAEKLLQDIETRFGECELQALDVNLYVTIGMDWRNSVDLSDLLEWIFDEHYQLPDDAGLDYEIIHLGMD